MGHTYHVPLLYFAVGCEPTDVQSPDMHGQSMDGTPMDGTLMDAGLSAGTQLLSAMQTPMGAQWMPRRFNPTGPWSLNAPQAELFQCSGAPGFRRINRLEWLRNIGLPSDHPAARNPLDPDESHPFPTYSQDVTLDTATVDQFLDMNHIRARHGLPDSPIPD